MIKTNPKKSKLLKVKSKVKRYLLIGGSLLSAGVGAYFQVLRPWQINWGATLEEGKRNMPGDEIIVSPTIVSTRAITINTPPELIWPWLAQLGQGRGGWYSYQWIENELFKLDIHNTEEILPQFQELKPGDVIPTGAPGLDIPVLEVEPNQLLLIGEADFSTIAFGLYPLGERRTRLVIRTRARFSLTPSGIFWLVLMDPGMFIMTRKMLLEIKHRAERLYHKPTVTSNARLYGKPGLVK